MASYLYYNIDIANETNDQFKLARFDETRTVPILDVAQDYELSIVRFKVPTSTIPKMVWPGNDIFKITMTWRGVTKSAFLINTALTVPLYNEPVTFSYQNICDIFNVAMKDIYDQFAATFPGPFPPNPDWIQYTFERPFLLFNPDTLKFEFRVLYETPNYTDPPAATKSFGNWSRNPTDPSNRIDLFFNESLGNLLKNFYYNYNIASVDERFLFIIENYNNNIIDYVGIITEKVYLFKQEIVSLSSINDFQSLIFRTVTVPVEYELIGSQRNILSRILTDFDVDNSDLETDYILYFPQGPLRYYPLNSTSELRNFDVQVFWKDRFGNEFPLYLAPRDTLSIKIQFRKISAIVLKDVLEDEQNIF